MNAKFFIKTKTKQINLRRNRIGALNRIDSTCLQTTGIENDVCQYSGFSSALVMLNQSELQFRSSANTRKLLDQYPIFDKSY